MTAFQETVLALLKQIPKGKITTYSAVARALGKPHAARAVGNACNQNPFATSVPCHRVVRSNGSIGGYAKGVRKKIELLNREGIAVKNGKVLNFKKHLIEL